MPTPQFGALTRYATLRQLQVFQTVAELESYTKAAAVLHLTQPTISMQIKRLVDAVDMPLFEQIGKRLYLTGAGKELLATCHDVFERLGRLEMSLADLRGMKQGQLRLAVVTTAVYVAPRLIGEFCNLYPGVDVALEVTNRAWLLKRLADNRDDLYILGQPPSDIEVEAFPFMSNPLVIMTSRNHPLVGARVSLQRLLEEPFILREPGSGTRKTAERLFAERGFKPKVRMELGSNEAIKQTVASGLGVAVISSHALSLQGRDSPVAVLDVEDFPLVRQWYLVYPRGKQLSVVARGFMEYLRERMEVPDYP